MSGSVRVLVVDDAAFMRRTLIRLLKQAPEVEIVGEARNGEEAVAVFRETRPDVVCLDIDMPSMDGGTALKHFMAIRPTPVVVVSSLTNREDVPFELFRLGVIDFFPKPTSLVGAIEDQTRLLLYLVKNAKTVRTDNLARVPVGPEPPDETQPEPLRHQIVVAGSLGSVGPLLRLLSLLPAGGAGGFGMVCRVPLHQAVVASFERSVARLFGWTVLPAEESVPLAAGRLLFVPPGVRPSFPSRESCRLEAGDSSLDDLFSASARAMRADATMLLLGGSEATGLAGLAEASGFGARCYVQDPDTALFATWRPHAPAGVDLLTLESVVVRILERTGLARRPAEGGL